jgi:hypothetical protein
VVAPAYVDYGMHRLGPVGIGIDDVLAHLGHMESHNTLPRFMDDRRDSVQPTQGLLREVFTWKMTLGQGRTRPVCLFDSHHEKWPLVLPLWLTCVILSGYFPCKVSIDLNLCDTLRYG